MSIDATDVSTDAIVTITERALAKVLELKLAEDEPGSLGLRIEVTGATGTDYTYDLAFESLAEAEAEDSIQEKDGLAIVVPADSIDRLRGAVLDLPSNADQGGLVLRNPNRPDPLAGRTLELSGSVAERVAQLLEVEVNPAIAAHGGFATLVGVDGDTAYITMGGGCQGCAMSKMTLTQGIETAILEAVPEILHVVDATDHTAGENPFYQ